MLFVYLIIVEWQSYHYCSTRRYVPTLSHFNKTSSIITIGSDHLVSQGHGESSSSK